MRLDQLEPLRIAIWGFGREGRAALRALRSRYSSKPLTLLCSVAEGVEAEALADPQLKINTNIVDAAALMQFDVVIKSPGISPHRPPASIAIKAGVRFISGSTIWFAEHQNARTICITGTKGKSTTAALVAHLLRALGVRTALCGNIGQPLLELLEIPEPPAWWVIELSSFQTWDFAGKPDIAVVTNIVEEHLDWHGSIDQYIADKLLILGYGDTRCLLNAEDQVLRDRVARGNAEWFNHAGSWHVAGDYICYGQKQVAARRDLPLPGQHNAVNVCAALAAVAAAGFDAIKAAASLKNFQLLPHRLQSLGLRAGIEYVNDSIATTPQAAIAALTHFSGRSIAIILGGHDRGLDWQSFADHIAQFPPHAIVCTGATRQRIMQLLQPQANRDPGFVLFECENFDQAFANAKATLQNGGVLLLSPGAPSFGQFRDYIERGKRFAELAGFDPQSISGVGGLGIA